VNRFLETLYDDIRIADLVDEEKQCVEKIEGRGAPRHQGLPREQQSTWTAQKMQWYTRTT